MRVCVCVCAGKINWNANAAASKVLQFHCILSGGHKLNMAAPESVCVCVCVRTRLHNYKTNAI